MRKIVSAFIALAVLLTILSVAAVAQQPQPDLGFAVASDLHYNIPETELTSTNDDPIFWYANRRAAMENESGYIIDEFLNQCENDSTCEYVLISGDLVDSGRKIVQEHYDVAEKLRDFEQRSGKQVFVINGNHDLGTDSETDTAKFKEIYNDFGYSDALAADSDSCSYTANLGEKYRLIALDSCDPDKSTQDGMTAKKLNWVRQQASQAKKDGRYPILMMHHNLLDHMPMQRILSANFIVKFHSTTAELFADWGIKLVLTGHEHCSDAAVFTSALGNVIYDFATTSLTMYPLEYRVMTLTEDEIAYSAKAIESIDTDALSAAVSGYTPEQLALMNSGLNSFSEGFLKAGVRYRLELSLSPEKLGIKESDIYYDLVMTAVNGLTDILEMPLYGENGAQELAKEYGINLPDSDYENGWDLITRIVAMHYEGSESYGLESTEITLLLKTAALILRTDLPAIRSELFAGAGNAIFEKLGTFSLLGQIFPSMSVTPCEYLLVAIASPLIYDFTSDDDGVDDNNGIIPGYGTASVEGNLENIGLNVQSFFTTLIKYLGFIFNYIAKIFVY